MRPERTLSRRTALLAGLGTAVLPKPRTARAATAPLTIFAAASLTDALHQIDAAMRAQGLGHGVPGAPAGVRFSFGSSGQLAKQIDQGAPADLFLSADEKWMDWLAGRGKLDASTRRDLVGNTLVLVERKDRMQPVTLAPGVDLASRLGSGGRLAVGDPAQVPAGIYAKQALTSLGLWDQVKDRLAPAENVRAALLLVERGEAPAGIVYASDVRAGPGLAIAGRFPPSSHTPIVYPGAVLKSAADGKRAQAYLAYLAGGTAQAIFHNLGFSAPPR